MVCSIHRLNNRVEGGASIPLTVIRFARFVALY